MRWFRARYGSTPLHLLSILASFALAAYAALQASRGPLPLRMLVWFVAAVLAHDLVLFPVYALLDRLLGRARRQPAGAPDGSVNWVRVPALLSGVLLLISLPLVMRQGEGSYRAASGLDESPYLARWLILTALLFAGSGLLLVAKSLLRRRSA